MLWIVGFFILLVALMIPILAIVLDAPVLRNFLEARHRTDPGKLKEQEERIARLEEQVDDLDRAVEGLREENQFLRQLLENPARGGSRKLPPAAP